MAGNGRLRHPEDFRKLTNTQRLLHHEMHDAPTRDIGEGFGKYNDITHNEIIRNEPSQIIKPVFRLSAHQW